MSLKHISYYTKDKVSVGYFSILGISSSAYFLGAIQFQSVPQLPHTDA